MYICLVPVSEHVFAQEEALLQRFVHLKSELAEHQELFGTWIHVGLLSHITIQPCICPHGVIYHIFICGTSACGFLVWWTASLPNLQLDGTRATYSLVVSESQGMSSTQVQTARAEAESSLAQSARLFDCLMSSCHPLTRLPTGFVRQTE